MIAPESAAAVSAATLGLGCLLVGLAIRNPEFGFVVRAISIAAFMVLTTAVGAHVIARAAALTGVPLWKVASSTSVHPTQLATMALDPDSNTRVVGDVTISQCCLPLIVHTPPTLRATWSRQS